MAGYRWHFAVWILTFVLNSVTLAQQERSSPRLVIMPISSVQRLALNQSLYLACSAEVDDKSLLEDFRWEKGGESITSDKSGKRKYTEMTSDNTLSLFIRGIAEDDRGEYICTAVYDANQRLEARVTIETFMDITWEDAPVEQHPVANTDAKIRCKVKAKPSPDIDWMKDDRPFKGDDRCIIESDGVMCRPIREQDNGQYTCRVRVKETGHLQDRSIKVDVYVTPKVEEIDEYQSVVEEESITLRCLAIGKPPPEYTWLDKNNADLFARSGYVVDPKVGTLTIESAAREDAGTLRCIAKNLAGEDSRDTSLTVTVKPRIQSYENRTTSEGSEVTLECRVLAESRTDVQFQKVGSRSSFMMGQQEQDPRIKVSRNDISEFEMHYTLEIQGVQRSDEGLYMCTATNDGGTVTKYGYVTVEYKPIFTESPPSSIISWMGNILNVTCTASAIPNATITWNTPIKRDMDEDEGISIFGTGPSSTLQINSADESYFGDYMCEASNSQGRTSHRFLLQRAYPPEPILQAEVVSITATTITFNFHGPRNDGGMPIEAFVVEYHEEGDSFDGNIRQREWFVGTPYILEKLEPERKYHFRYACRNKVGLSAWYPQPMADSHTMKKKSAPEEPAIITHSDDTKHDVKQPVEYIQEARYYELHWNIPADNGERITSFNISYYPVQNESGKWEAIGERKEDTAYPTETKHLLSQLSPDTFYKVELRAVNTIGNSLPGELVIKTALDPDSVVREPVIVADDGTGEQQEPTIQEAGIPTELIVGIVIAGIILFLLAIDLACYTINKCGLIMCICVHVCKKTQYDKEAATEEGRGVLKIEAKKLDGKKQKPAVEDDHKDTNEETPMITDGKYNDKEKEALTNDMRSNGKNRSPRGSKSSIAKAGVV